MKLRNAAVLIAITESQIRHYISDRLRSDWAITEAASISEALHVLQVSKVECVVMTSRLAVLRDRQDQGLRSFISEHIGTVTLLFKEDIAFFADFYQPPQHECVSMPCDVDHVASLVHKVITSTSGEL
jgi:DNA-binding NtrC family response regulator